eukprot:scaffold12595_cov65-Phaeocystis_antarctica.AAC.1
MGLRTGPIQEGSQPGPRLDRKARAGKYPTAQWGFKTNQACIRNFGVCTDATTGIERAAGAREPSEGPRSGTFGGFGSRKPDFHHKIVSNLQVPRLSRTPFR